MPGARPRRSGVSAERRHLICPSLPTSPPISPPANSRPSNASRTNGPPCSTASWTWFITEFNEAENTAFGLVNGHEAEVGYIDLNELATARGRMGIGIEIDMHFKPQTLGACRAALDARAD